MLRLEPLGHLSYRIWFLTKTRMNSESLILIVVHVWPPDGSIRRNFFSNFIFINNNFFHQLTHGIHESSDESFYFNCMVWHIHVMQTKRMVTLFEFDFIMEWLFHSFPFWIITKSKPIGNLVIQLRWNSNSHWYTTKLEWNLIWFNYFISSLSKRGIPHFFQLVCFYVILYCTIPFFVGSFSPKGDEKNYRMNC